MRRNLAIFVLTCCLGMTTQVHAQLMSVKTNALMDLLTVPNIDLSITTGNSTAVSASVFGSQKVLGNKVEMWGIKPEFRYWLSGRTHTGYFVGLSIVGVSYDITWKKEVHQGDAFGGGVVFGYDVYLSKHWTLDLHGGFGGVYFHQQSYSDGDKILQKDFTEKGILTVPYDIGVSVVYIFR